MLQSMLPWHNLQSHKHTQKQQAAAAAVAAATSDIVRPKKYATLLLLLLLLLTCLSACLALSHVFSCSHSLSHTLSLCIHSVSHSHSLSLFLDGSLFPHSLCVAVDASAFWLKVKYKPKQPTQKNGQKRASAEQTPSAAQKPKDLGKCATQQTPHATTPNPLPCHCSVSCGLSPVYPYAALCQLTFLGGSSIGSKARLTVTFGIGLLMWHLPC